MRLLLAALLAALTIPFATASPDGTVDHVTFTSTPAPTSFVLVVPQRMDLVVTIGLHEGAATDLDLEGPGFCSGTQAAAMGVYDGRTRRVELRVQCGVVQPGNYDLSLSSMGAVRGWMAAKGAFFLEPASPLDGTA